VSQWLGTVGDDLHDKLAKVGLVPARHSKTLATFLEAYKAERVDAKPRTVMAWNTSIKLMVGFLGDVPLRSITQEQAALYRAHLVKQDYATAYIAKTIMNARMFFNVAKRRKLIDDNPFQYVEKGSQVNKEREHYVTQDETDHLINACSNVRDRLRIALARYAGLRCPSELVGLRWSEINWEAGRFTVYSPKTERKGKDKRIVPIFKNLYPYLSEAFDLAPEGEDRIFPEIHETKSLGSWIKKLAARAGVALWEKPFQNMRSSCATGFIPPMSVRHGWGTLARLRISITGRSQRHILKKRQKSCALLTRLLTQPL
jgi:integrase